jgi:general stress protein YciG
MTDHSEIKTSSKRGFASMDPQRQREIASLGGKAAHASGRAHEFNSAEAREAGRKGGRAGRRKSADASAQP